MPTRRDPSQMNAQAIVDEIREIRDEIQEKSTRMAVLARTLYAQARRRDVRREFEAMAESISDLEKAIRTASVEQRGPLQDQIIRLRRLRQEQQERISVYTTFSNNWLRFAGMLAQGVQRSLSFDRLVDRLPRTTEEDAPNTPTAPSTTRPVQGRQESGQNSVFGDSPFDDLIELYGEEMLNADRR